MYMGTWTILSPAPPTRPPVSASATRHVCIHVIYMCGACVAVKPSTPLSSGALAEAFSGFTCSVPFLNIGFILSCQNVAVSREGTTGQAMWAGDTFQVEKVFINDSVEGGAGNSVEAGEKNHVSTT